MEAAASFFHNVIVTPQSFNVIDSAKITMSRLTDRENK